MIIKLILIACALFMPAQAHAQSLFFMPNPLLDQKLPEFSLSSTHRDKVNIPAELKGKKGIIFFWATWCPHCRAALKEIIAHKEELDAQEIKVVFIDVGESKGTVERYLKKTGSGNPEIFLDETNTVTEEFAVIGLPTFFYVQEDGIVTAVEHGFSMEMLESVFGG